MKVCWDEWHQIYSFRKKAGKWEISLERAQDKKSENEDSTESTKYYFNTKYTAKVIQNALSQIGSVKIIHAQVDLKMAKCLP